jgi:hypothetical protein
MLALLGMDVHGPFGWFRSHLTGVPLQHVIGFRRTVVTATNMGYT